MSPLRERARAFFTRRSPGVPEGWRSQANQFHLARDLLGRTTLDRRSESLFEPGEEIIATFGAMTGSPELLAATFGTGVIAATMSALALHFSLQGSSPPVVSDGLAIAAALLDASLLGSLVLLRLTRSRRVIFIATTAGLVQCRRDWLGRPRQVISRQPAVAPTLLQSTSTGRKVALGETVVWVSPKTDQLMGWMASLG